MKIDVCLSEKEFFQFSWFDALRCKKIWRSPAIFAAILGGSAIICFLMRHVRGAAALGAVLLAAGIGIPAAYFLKFFLSLRGQALKAGLAGAKHVYTIELRGGDGVVVDNGREHAVYRWDQVFHAYRTSNAVYLYITPQRAFLIPNACVEDGADRVWELIENKIPETRRDRKY